MPVRLVGLGVGRRRLEALRWLCRAVSPLTPDGLAAPPPPPLWPAVVALADSHLLLPALKLALDRHGLAAHAPEEAVAALADLHELNALRNARLCEQMLELSRALAAAGVAPVWLKGAVELIEPGWEHSGRMMNDLDLWVPDPAGQATALACLDRLGYRVLPGEDDDAWSQSHHYAGRAHESWPVRVELHRFVVAPASRALLPDDEVRREAVWLDWRGVRVGRPSARHRLLHAAIQATTMAVPSFATGRTPLAKALDVVRRAADDFGGHIPGDIRRVLADPAWDGMAAPFTTMTDRLFGLSNPLVEDLSALRRLEVAAAHPRLEFLARMTARVFSRRLPGLLARPAAIPAAFGRFVGAVTTGRDVKGE